MILWSFCLADGMNVLEEGKLQPTSCLTYIIENHMIHSSFKELFIL